MCLQGGDGVESGLRGWARVWKQRSEAPTEEQHRGAVCRSGLDKAWNTELKVWPSSEDVGGLAL